MGTNQRRKETNSTSNTGSIVDKQEQRFQWWRLIVGAAAVLVAALIPLLWESLKIDPPRFVLLNPITRPDSGITVVAQNRIAGRQMTLNIEFDGFLFVEAGRLIMSSYPQHWHFSIKDRNLPDSLMHDGIHHVRVGFAGMPLSEQLNLIFHTQKPVVEARVVQPPGREKDRIVTGRVASKLQVPSETLRVDIIFHYEGHPHQIPVPVKRVVDESTQLIYFEFEIVAQGLPTIPPNDLRNFEPFFTFRVTDQANNQYTYQESYAHFMAQGDKRFGIGRLADIEVKHFYVDFPQQTATIAAFRLIPKQTHLPEGKPAITLKVTSYAPKIKILEWTNLLNQLSSVQSPVIVLRDEKPIAIVFGNVYLDEHAPENHEPSYRVTQTKQDSLLYASEVVQASTSTIQDSTSCWADPLDPVPTILVRSLMPPTPLEIWKASRLGLDDDREAKIRFQWVISHSMAVVLTTAKEADFAMQYHVLREKSLVHISAEHYFPLQFGRQWTYQRAVYAFRKLDTMVGYTYFGESGFFKEEKDHAIDLRSRMVFVMPNYKPSSSRENRNKSENQFTIKLKNPIPFGDGEAFPVETHPSDGARDGRYHAFSFSSRRTIWLRKLGKAGAEFIEVTDLAFYSSNPPPYSGSSKITVERPVLFDAGFSMVRTYGPPDNPSNYIIQGKIVDLYPEVIKVPAGEFSNCLRMIEYLEPRISEDSFEIDNGWVTISWFAPNVGLIRELQYTKGGRLCYEMQLTSTSVDSTLKQ